MLNVNDTIVDKKNSYDYLWPREDTFNTKRWKLIENSELYALDLPEELSDLKQDSRWPALFPSAICIITIVYNGKINIEKVVAPSIVNRFPYIMAVTFCREEISSRHYSRNVFMKELELSQKAAIHFFAPGPALNKILHLIETVPAEKRNQYLNTLGMKFNYCDNLPIFDDAFLVYQTQCVQPLQDFNGEPIYLNNFKDVGSHRIYFLEINNIQLDKKIANDEQKIFWQSLPSWKALATPAKDNQIKNLQLKREFFLNQVGYSKKYTPHYYFPSENTVAFEFDDYIASKAVKYLAPLPADQVEVDNDRARWPCFFPSSLGIITCRDNEGKVTAMPCGSTTVVSRHPLVIAICVSYSYINIRYAPRATLDFIRKNGTFGCGISYIEDSIIEAINYLGNVSHTIDPNKFEHSGLTAYESSEIPIIKELPIHFDCKVIEEVKLGTHIMFLGEVKRIVIRKDVTAENPLKWCPWANCI